MRKIHAVSELSKYNQNTMHSLYYLIQQNKLSLSLLILRIFHKCLNAILCNKPYVLYQKDDLTIFE